MTHDQNLGRVASGRQLPGGSCYESLPIYSSDSSQGYGGVTFAISPGDASVTVDGIYAGVVEQYDNPESPLNLPPGEHHIEIQAPGYRTLDFNVNVERGEVIPYAGDLQHN